MIWFNDSQLVAAIFEAKVYFYTGNIAATIISKDDHSILFYKDLKFDKTASFLHQLSSSVSYS